jgi:hypothetical protein
MEIQYRTQLPELLKHFNLPLTGIELGSAEGYSAFDFMRAGMEELTLVDLWAKIEGHSGDGGNENEWHNRNYDIATGRLAVYGDKVKFLRGLTGEMAAHIPDNSVSLVYVDADHSFEGVWADINNYWPKLVSGGIMGFHDFENVIDYKVKDAVMKFANENGLEVHSIPENKLEDAGAWIQKK